MKKHCLVLGYFGTLNNQLDGQTVKTREVFKLFREKAFDYNVVFFDTQYLRKSFIYIFKMMYYVVISKKIIYIPAHNNLKFFLPILFVLSRIFNSEIHYFVVGGWLADFIKDKPLLRFILRKISTIHSETDLLIKRLNQEYNIHNVYKFNNFRYVSDSNVEDDNGDSGIFKLVFMSRINKMKGYEVVLELAKRLSRYNIQIDFYGPINIEDSSHFLQTIKGLNNVTYNGILSESKITSVLKKYDVLVLPTKYYTEGLPGAIVDAYFAGIPVIATNWLHASEFIDNNETGFIIPFKDGESYLYEKVMLLYSEKTILIDMKSNAKSKSAYFTATYAWSQVSFIFKKK